MDATMPHDSNSVVQCLQQTIEGVIKQCRAKGLPLPLEVVIWVSLGNYIFQLVCI
jgi:hypothetical protein